MTAVQPAGLDIDALSAWFREHVPGSGANDTRFEATVLSGGRSNLTYAITNAEHQWVLRRPPLGHLLDTAHDMRREYTVLQALEGTGVPTPRTAAFCTDPRVIGVPFYVMEKVDGTIVRSASDASSLSEAQARACSIELIDVLVRIHGVDWRTAGLAGWGHPDGYLERQLRRWRRQWEAAKTRDLRRVDEVADRLAAALPTSPPPTIVHGDYRLDNVVFDMSGAPRARAVLDWEMSTLGDPLADLGLLMVYWDEVGDTRPPLPVATRVTARPGFLSRNEMVAEYSRRSGRSTANLAFYVVLGYFKLAIILESIHRRHREGNTIGEGFESLGDGVPVIVDLALETASQSDVPGLGGG